MELNKNPSITPNVVVLGFLKFKMANSNNDKCLDTPSSLSIATQLVRRVHRRNHLHNPALRVTIRPLETRTTSCPTPVKVHRAPGGKRFYAHESLEIWLSTILKYKFILLWRNSTVCDHLSNRKSNYSLTSAYIFISTLLPHFTALLLNVPSYWNPAFFNALHEAIL